MSLLTVVEAKETHGWTAKVRVMVPRKPYYIMLKHTWQRLVDPRPVLRTLHGVVKNTWEVICDIDIVNKYRM